MKNKEIICGIYLIINPVGKVYIGQSENIYYRWKNYYKLSCKKQTKLYNSLKKYGSKNHKYEILEKCLFEELNCKERYWQDFYNSGNREKGLNLLLTECEDKKHVTTQETKDKIAASVSLYAKNKIKLVYQYSLDGILIKIWNSPNDVKRELGYAKGYIHDCCKGKFDKVYEFIWSYKEKVFSLDFLQKVKITKSEKMTGHKFNLGRDLTKEHKNKISLKTKGFKHSKETKNFISKSKYIPIIQLDLQGNFIKEW